MNKRTVSDHEVTRIDTGDAAEVVYASDWEMPVVQLQNRIWAEEPRYLAFVGHEAEREIYELIDALQSLLKARRA